MQASPVLVVVSGRACGLMIKLEPGEYTIGRTEACDIHLEGHGISRRHARLVVDTDGSVVLEDLRSRNGTHVDGEALKGPTQLSVGSTFRVGPISLKLFTPSPIELSSCATPLDPGTDPFTGLPNREAGRRRLKSAVADPELWPTSALLVDVDGLAALNRSRGYGVGDQLLLAISRELEPLLREGDVLAYRGAGQWMIVAEQMGLGTATELGEALRDVVATMTLPNGQRGSVTVSVGVTSFGEGSTGDTLAELEAALRQAKDTGRNRVCVRASERDR